VCEQQEFILEAFIGLKPVKKMQYMSDMRGFKSFSNLLIYTTKWII